MAPKYKLVYFNVRGRAEISRILFAQAGVEYEDCRVNQEEFAAMKNDAEKCPLGQLPVLMIEGHNALPQSHVIERHLARTFGMYGKTEKETCVIDLVCETAHDLASPLMKMHFEKDEAKKAEMVKTFVEKDSKTILTALSQGLQKNNEGKGYFVGDTMTLADVTMFTWMDGLLKHMSVLGTMYPPLKEFTDRMSAEPKIAAWLAKRPVTDM